jgi:hypothetical protein
MNKVPAPHHFGFPVVWIRGIMYFKMEAPDRYLCHHCSFFEVPGGKGPCSKEHLEQCIGGYIFLEV